VQNGRTGIDLLDSCELFHVRVPRERAGVRPEIGGVSAAAAADGNRNGDWARGLRLARRVGLVAGERRQPRVERVRRVPGPAAETVASRGGRLDGGARRPRRGRPPGGLGREPRARNGGKVPRTRVQRGGQRRDVAQPVVAGRAVGGVQGPTVSRAAARHVRDHRVLQRGAVHAVENGLERHQPIAAFSLKRDIVSRRC